MKIKVINGPNLNMLGIREPAIYGKETYKDLEVFVEEISRELSVECEMSPSQLL